MSDSLRAPTSLSNTLHGARPLAEAVRELYAEGQTDYSLDPIVLEQADGMPAGRIKDGDAVIFCCRRGEREIQLTEAFTDPHLDQFPREKFVNLPFVILTLYHDKFKDLPVAFAPSQVEETLTEIVSRAGLHQVHISESEKFAHVTFFFNGGNGRPFPGEEDISVPSLKGVPFDKFPELSLAEVSGKVIEQLEKGTDLVITNFANGDVIGHTSNVDAKLRCVEFVDQHLGEVIRAARSAGYVSLITADHGNIEETVAEEGAAHVSHTNNPVPLFVIDPRSDQLIEPAPGKLADLGPTILQIMGLPKPEQMTGKSLVSGHAFGSQRKVLLVILDGWGISDKPEQDPIAIGRTPAWDQLMREYPYAQLAASGEAVGLKPGKAGNSEAGHINIGAGRVILQDDVRLDQAMKDGSFYTNDIICREIEGVKSRGSSLHLIGLLTEKSSHGSIDYPLAVLKMAKAAGLENVFLHMIFDGRSTAPGSAPALLEKLGSLLAEIGIGCIVTGIGRGIALDRDGNYHKTHRAYNTLVYGTGKKARQ